MNISSHCVSSGCDKPGVPGEKGLPCTSIRNHSSGEDKRRKYVSVKSLHHGAHMAENKEQITPSNKRERETPSGLSSCNIQIKGHVFIYL